ncbi:hypothetical protein GGS26DRAFT_428702 [Hypomontagnella submonticulosa]|nr:hypothetical protein GGS26DRAFT_428702 [Hypomontagnella submonticulosa]
MRAITLMILPFLGGVLGFDADIEGPWDIELQEDGPNSCHPWQDTFEKAYEEAAQMVAKVQTDIQVVTSGRPGLTRSGDISRIVDWDRIDRNMHVIFGVRPDFSGKIDATYLNDINFVWRKMGSMFKGSVNNPEHGYSGKFDKPAIACGDKGWRYIGPDDNSPDRAPGTPLRDAHSEYAQTGVWYWNRRFAWYPTSNTQTVGICRENIAGVTTVFHDLVTFCETALNEANPKWVVDDKSNIALHDNIDDFGQHALSRTIVHEFAHYHGFGGFTQPNPTRVIDFQAVNANGDLVYVRDGRTTTDKGPDDNPNSRYDTYFWRYVSNLAHVFNGPDPAADRTGPKQTTHSAESFAYFALLSYLDNWDWTTDGKARPLPTSRDQIHP